MIRRVLSVFLPLIVVFCFPVVLLNTATAQIIDSSETGKTSFTYDVVNEEVIITGLSDEYTTDLIIPEKIEGYPVTSINSNAFCDCSQITSIYVPTSVKTIGMGAFKGTKPQRVVLPFIGKERGVTGSQGVFGFIFGYDVGHDIPSGTVSQYSHDSNSGYQYYYYFIPDTIKEVVITDETRIPEYAFKDCSWIKSIELNQAVEYIGPYAFINCTSLDNFELPESITEIDIHAFRNCSSLSGNLVIPAGATKIGAFAYSGCSAISSISIPKSVSSIGVSAFRGTNPSKVVLPFIGKGRSSDGSTGVFGYIFGFESSRVNVLGSSEKIPAGAILQYEKEIDPVTYTRYYYFVPQSIKEVIVYDETHVPQNAFLNCSWINKVSINDIIGDISVVGDNAFKNCTEMTVYINRKTAVHTYCERKGIRHCSTKEMILDTESINLLIDDSTTVGSEVYLLNGELDDEPETMWFSSDESIAKVDRLTGLITAVAPGTAIITADSEGVTATVSVNVCLYTIGDVDGDKTVTIIDATFIQRQLASIPISFEFNNKVADTDEDESVTIIDATYIQRWLASLSSNENIGMPI